MVESFNNEPSETSPLLAGSHQNGNGHATADTINEVVPDSAVQVDGGGADLERQRTADSGREAQFKGNEDVKKHLMYIVPAVSVGKQSIELFCCFTISALLIR